MASAEGGVSIPGGGVFSSEEDGERCIAVAVAVEELDAFTHLTLDGDFWLLIETSLSSSSSSPKSSCN